MRRMGNMQGYAPTLEPAWSEIADKKVWCSIRRILKGGLKLDHLVSLVAKESQHFRQRLGV